MEAEGDGDVQLKLVFLVEHEKKPIQMVGLELSVGPVEVDFVEEAPLPVLEDLVGQGNWVGEPELEWSAVQRIAWRCRSLHWSPGAWRAPQ